MKKKVDNCSTCPLKCHNYGHGENFYYCSHPDSPKGFGSIIDSPHPNWCPLKKGDYVISLNHVEKEGEIQEYEIWSEGYCANETNGWTDPVLLGKAEGISFEDACVWLLKHDKRFDFRRMTYWGCKLFPYKPERK